MLEGRAGLIYLLGELLRLEIVLQRLFVLPAELLGQLVFLRSRVHHLVLELLKLVSLLLTSLLGKDVHRVQFSQLRLLRVSCICHCVVFFREMSEFIGVFRFHSGDSFIISALNLLKFFTSCLRLLLCIILERICRLAHRV